MLKHIMHIYLIILFLLIRPLYSSGGYIVHPVQEALQNEFGTEAWHNNNHTNSAINDVLDVINLSRQHKIGGFWQIKGKRKQQLISDANQITALSLQNWITSVTETIENLPKTNTLAFLRRIITAAAVKLWIREGRRLSDDNLNALGNIFRQLFLRHKEGAKEKGIMEYMHVSKSGGTSWCHVAELNSCVTEKFDRAYVCQVRNFDDRVRWINMTFHLQQVADVPVPKYVRKRFSRYGTYRGNPSGRSCAARYNFMRENGWNYYSNEYTVVGHRQEEATLCTNFFTAISVRHPHQRLVSHLHFVMWSMGSEKGYGDPALFHRVYGNRTATFWEHMGPAIADNYLTRTLLGEDVYHLPVGGVGPAHGRAAQLRLMQFDMLVTLEQPRETQDLILQYGTGWQLTLRHVHDKDSRARMKQLDTRGLMPNDLHLLLRRQEVDLQLHRFANILASLDAVVFRAIRLQGLAPWSEEDGQKVAEEGVGEQGGKRPESERENGKTIATIVPVSESISSSNSNSGGGGGGSGNSVVRPQQRQRLFSVVSSGDGTAAAGATVSGVAAVAAPLPHSDGHCGYFYKFLQKGADGGEERLGDSPSVEKHNVT